MPRAILASVLGSDPATIALGVKLLLGRLPRQDLAVFLLEDGAPKDGFFQRRLDALEKWLQNQGIPTKRIPLGELPNLSENVVLNLSGGTKFTFARLYHLAQQKGWKGFLLEAHSWPHWVATLEGKTWRLAEETLLTAEEYQALYLAPAGGKVREASGNAFPKIQGLPQTLWQEIELEGHQLLFTVVRGRPLFYQPLPTSGRKKFKEHVNRLAALARRLGGQHAVPLTDEPQRTIQSQPPSNRERMRALLHTQAREAGVYLLSPEGLVMPPLSFLKDQPTPLHPPRPFPLPREGPILLALLGEQPIPLLASFLAHRPREVFLATSRDLEARSQVLAQAKTTLERRGLRVHVATVSHPGAMSEVEALFRPVVQAAQGKGIPVWVNLNGGTKLMSLGLLRATQGVEGPEYLEGSRLKGLSGREMPVPWSETGASEVLGLYGYQAEGHGTLGRIAPNGSVLKAAEEVLKNPHAKQKAEDFLKAWQRAFGLKDRAFSKRQQLDARGTGLGLALEYVAYYHLRQHFSPRGGKVYASLSLRPLRDTSQMTPREVDGLIWYKGSLVFLECKPGLSEALRAHDEGAALAVLQERFGGLFSRGILLVRETGQLQTASPRLRELLQRPGVVVFSLSGRLVLPEGTIYAFPQDLEQALDW